MTLSQYYDALARHDWDYAYSDDPNKYRAGMEQERKLRAIADQSKAHATLWERFVRWHRADGAKKMPRRPKS